MYRSVESFDPIEIERAIAGLEKVKPFLRQASQWEGRDLDSPKVSTYICTALEIARDCNAITWSEDEFAYSAIRHQLGGFALLFTLLKRQGALPPTVLFPWPTHPDYFKVRDQWLNGLIQHLKESLACQSSTSIPSAPQV